MVRPVDKPEPVEPSGAPEPAAKACPALPGSVAEAAEATGLLVAVVVVMEPVLAKGTGTGEEDWRAADERGVASDCSVGDATGTDAANGVGLT